jgi:nucleoside 2-deoxyribosyltransferase
MSTERVYFAAPLFSPLEREFNLRLTEILQARFSVFLPQRDGLLLANQPFDATNYAALARTVFQSDIEAIRTARLVFAVLDGRTVDEGVAFELGFAYALQKRCVAFHSDPRVLLRGGINPMIRGPIELFLSTEHEVRDWVERH